MFRRKEESLFDSATDPNQDSTESTSLVNPSAHAPASQSSSPASSQTSYGQSLPRPPASAQPASSFRPATPASPMGDISRNRMPETSSKPAAAPSPSFSSQPLAQTPATPAPSAPVEKSSKSSSNSSVRRVLTVGNDILLKGEIATCDRLVIEGKVEATLNDVHTVEISESGSFKGSANIEDAEIRGIFDGDLVVRNRLVIYATGRVRGKITYGEIEIERGGELTGEIKSNVSASSGSQYAPAPRARQTKDDKVAA